LEASRVAVSAAIINQPQAAETAKQPEARAIDLMKDLRIRVGRRFAKEVAEGFVELLGAIETAPCARHDVGIGRHAGADRSSEHRGLLVDPQAQCSAAEIEDPQ